MEGTGSCVHYVLNSHTSAPAIAFNGWVGAHLLLGQR